MTKPYFNYDILYSRFNVYRGGAFDVLTERAEQVDKHGFTEAKDKYRAKFLVKCAEAYTTAATQGHNLGRAIWPGDPVLWKPRSARANLVKAAALLIAAIDSYDNADVPMQEPTQKAKEAPSATPSAAGVAAGTTKRAGDPATGRADGTENPFDAAELANSAEKAGNEPPAFDTAQDMADAIAFTFDARRVGKSNLPELFKVMSEAIFTDLKPPRPMFKAAAVKAQVQHARLEAARAYYVEQLHELQREEVRIEQEIDFAKLVKLPVDDLLREQRRINHANRRRLASVVRQINTALELLDDLEKMK